MFFLMFFSPEFFTRNLFCFLALGQYSSCGFAAFRQHMFGFAASTLRVGSYFPTYSTAMELDAFRKNINEKCFTCSQAFLRHVALVPLACGELEDGPALIAMIVLMVFSMVVTWSCEKCKKRATLAQSRSNNELMWVCPQNQSLTHFRKRVEVTALSFLRPACWLAFLHVLVIPTNAMPTILVFCLQRFVLPLRFVLMQVPHG